MKYMKLTPCFLSGFTFCELFVSL